MIAFDVREVPLPRCKAHGQIGKWVVDGTDEWWCKVCMGIATRAAEMVLAPDRRLHRYHARRLTSCPFCYPGAVA